MKSITVIPWDGREGIAVIESSFAGYQVSVVVDPAEATKIIEQLTYCITRRDPKEIEKKRQEMVYWMKKFE